MALFLGLAKSSFAADVVPPPSVWLGGVSLPSDYANLMKPRSWAEVGKTIVPAIFSVVFFLSILACLFLIVRAGLMFVLSEGNKENIVKARVALTQALVGLALILSVFLIFNLVQLILGVNIGGLPSFGSGTDCHSLGTCGGKNQ